ncbi:MAG: hydrogenase, partial [Fimbriimonadaceae bacterium]
MAITEEQKLELQEQEKLIAGEQTYRSIEEAIDSIVLNQKRHKLGWYIVAGLGFIGANILVVSIGYLLYQGIGIWGNNQPVA